MPAFCQPCQRHSIINHFDRHIIVTPKFANLTTFTVLWHGSPSYILYTTWINILLKYKLYHAKQYFNWYYCNENAKINIHMIELLLQCRPLSLSPICKLMLLILGQAHCIFAFIFNDWLMFNVQCAIFQLYSRREHVYNKSICRLKTGDG